MLCIILLYRRNMRIRNSHNTVHHFIEEGNVCAVIIIYVQLFSDGTYMRIIRVIIQSGSGKP